MANASPQLILTSWLDDQNGPAKLTPRQRELLKGLEEAKDVDNSPPLNQGLTNPDTTTDDSHANSLKALLKPQWTPNEILKMFHEERQSIVDRGDECKGLLANVDSVLKEIFALKDLYLFISPKTTGLHSECKNIIQERNDLRESFERVNTSLNKQEELRSIFRRMPDIKNQILSILNNVHSGYQTGELHAGGTSLDEYHGRFYIECRRIKELTCQLESCLSTSNTDELLLHLEEIYTVYFDIREQLIVPVFSKNLSSLVSKADRNYCDLFRQTCTCLVRILRSEVHLFNQIFPSSSYLSVVQVSPLQSQASSKQGYTESESASISSGQNQDGSTTGQDFPVKRQALNGFLDIMCKLFYEHLRPVVIHINHLEILTKIYKLITETMRPEVQEEPYQQVMSQLAEDIQERMVFRTEVFIEESVLEYKPSGGDLAYPEKLEIVTGGELKEFQSMWYPTVQRTVLALFYLNQVFDPLTFRELAQEITLACLKSLDMAQRLIDERHSGSKMEATLFLSKHLDIIKDQLQAYGIDRIQFRRDQQQGKGEDEAKNSELVELDTGNLESMLQLFQGNEFCAASSESLWWQLNETIVSGTKWTLRAARMRK